jgi:hypothetical protein
MTVPTDQSVSDVSEVRARECESSARFWAEDLGPFASEMTGRAERYATYSAVLSAITGLGVWTTLVESAKWPAVILVSLVAFLSAFVVSIPKIKGYPERAKSAASLSSRYGKARAILWTRAS